jgi:D-alanine-D-alanine ligase
VLDALSHGTVEREVAANNLQCVTLQPMPGSAVLYALRKTSSGQTALEPLFELDVIFPVLHGTYGEDGTLQGLLEMASIAYVGAGVLASAAGMDKALFKDVMRANGLPVVESLTVTRRQIEHELPGVIAQAEQLDQYPLFTKPANLGSSVGITKCRSRSDLVEGLMEAAAYDQRVLIEHAVPNAREIEVSVLGNDQPQASVPGEVRPSGDFYTYDAKYIDERSQLIIPAVLPAALEERIRQLAVAAFRAIDGAGMARVDFLLNDATQEVYIGEINTIPGFTRISMYPKLWEASGLPYAALIDRLIELAIERKREIDRTQRQFRRRE